MQKFQHFEVYDEYKVPKKRHIESGRHLEFLRKKIFYKIGYLDHLISKKVFFGKKSGL
jgi:hypothetical protein